MANLNAQKQGSAGTSSEGKLDKLIIKSFSDSKFSVANDVEDFTAMLNPSTISQTLKINYQTEQAPDTSDFSAKYLNTEGQVFSFDLLLDGTGVTGYDIEVVDEIEKFKKATYYYIGSEHEAPYVQIIYGTYMFEGRLQSLQITHMLFKTNGDPLRSKLSASFISSTDPKKQASKQNRQSPDLTHSYTVKIGDTLPLLCQEIYKDSSYYLKVAKFNSLVDFRNLEPGTEIIFPPII